MAIEFGKGIALAGGFDLGAKAPLDSRLVVATIDDRDAHVTGNRAYDGMLVYVEANQITYQCVADAEGNLSWKEFGFNEADFISHIANDLETNDENMALSAAQGVALKGLIEAEAEAARKAESDLQVLVDSANEAIGANADAIATINDETNGILAQAKAHADSKDEAIQAAQTTADEANEAVGSLEARVSANEEHIGTMDNLATNAKGDIVSAINEVRASVSAGGTEAAVSLDTSVTTEGYLKSYTLYQGQTKIGVIDIPKELMAISGQIVVNPEGQPEGTYIELTIQNGDPVYIDVASLIDNYVAAENAAQVQIAINAENREISASLVAGGVGTDELADDAVTTVKIVDANVTKAKLSTEVQASLDKADAAAPQTALDNAIETLNTAIDDAKTAAISEAGTNADTKDAAILEEAKSYADSKVDGVDLTGIATNAENIGKLEEALELKAAQADLEAEVGAREALDARVVVVEGKAHTHANADELAKIVEGDVDKWNAISDDMTAYVDGEIDKVEAVLGEIESEKTVAQLISEARAAAEAGDTQAVADAQAYADGKIAEVNAVIGEVAENKTVITLIEEARVAAEEASNGYTDEKIAEVNAVIGEVESGKTVLDLIEAARASAVASAEEKDAVVLADAKKYADDKVAAIDLSGIDTNADNIANLQTAVEALQAVEHVEISETEISDLFPSA